MWLKYSSKYIYRYIIATYEMRQFPSKLMNMCHFQSKFELMFYNNDLYKFSSFWLQVQSYEFYVKHSGNMDGK